MLLLFNSAVASSDFVPCKGKDELLILACRANLVPRFVRLNTREMVSLPNLTFLLLRNFLPYRNWLWKRFYLWCSELLVDLKNCVYTLYSIFYKDMSFIRTYEAKKSRKFKHVNKMLRPGGSRRTFILHAVFSGDHFS